MTPVAGLLLAVLLGAAVRRRALVLPAALALAVGAGTTLAGQALNDRLAVTSWGGLPGSDLARVLRNATDPGSASNVGALGAGQGWYLLVATFGLAALGVVALAGHVRRGGPGERAVAVFTLGSLAGLMVLVGLFLRPPVRPDHLVYGRYAEVLVPVLLALGLVRLWTTPGRRVAHELLAAAGVAVAAAAVTSWYAGGLVGRSPVNWYSVLALPPLAQRPERIWLVSATLAAAAGAAVLAAVAARSRRWSAVGLAAVMVVSAVALRVVLVEARDEAIYAGRPSALSAVPGLATADRVAYDRAGSTPAALYSYQWELERTRFVLFDSRKDPVPEVDWVIAGPDWRLAGATRVWVHPGDDRAVWRLRGVP